MTSPLRTSLSRTQSKINTARAALERRVPDAEAGPALIGEALSAVCSTLTAVVEALEARPS